MSSTTPWSVSERMTLPDQESYLGRRDRTLFLVAAQTGLRASELIGLGCQDVFFRSGATFVASAKDARRVAHHLYFLNVSTSSLAEKGCGRGPAGLDTRTKWPTFRCTL